MTELVGIKPHPGNAELPSQRGRHVPGEPGLWVLLFGDLAVFTILFGAFLHSRGDNEDLFRHSQDALNRPLAALNTLVLLTSSLLVVLAVASSRQHRWHRLAPRLTSAAAAVGACFVVIKGVEYHEKLVAGITPDTNEFFMYYFVLTGLHLAHVIVGLGVLLALWRLARKPMRATHLAFFEGGGCYWHLVDLLWLVIYPLVFLVK